MKKEKIINYLRWAFFLPVSCIFTFIATKIIFYMNNSYISGIDSLSTVNRYISYFLEPIIGSICFFWVAAKLIPSSGDLKIRIPLIFILIICTINVYLNMLVYAGNIMFFDTGFYFDILENFIPSTLGWGICFIYILFVFCTKEYDRFIKQMLDKMNNNS